jgi:ornithine cyclodeaminase/alanine dehydrogenase-like protein (mu-crystallin family)
MLYLSQALTREVLVLDDVLGVIRSVAQWEHEQRIGWSNPPTSVLMVQEPRSRYRLKACALLDVPVVGIRLIGYPLAGGEDSEHSTRFVMLSDPATGEPLALIDDHWNYTLRTAASAVASAACLTPERPLSVGMVGSGNLAWAMLLLLRHIGRLGPVRVTSRRPERREAFAERVRTELRASVEPVATIAEAAADCDLLVTATNANARLVEPEWVRKGTTLCTLGRYELAPELYRDADKIVVDKWEVAKDVPDVKELLAAKMLSPERVHAEQHELLLGHKPGRESEQETILARCDGLVSQDVGIAYIVYKAALERGLGQQLK